MSFDDREPMDEITILKRPSIIAINTPVLVPPIRSKYSSGKV